MPYFPNSIMPLTPKQNSVGVFPIGNAIVATDFNLLDQELQAIQVYLLGQQGTLPDFSTRITDLINETNQIALRQSFANVLSGYCLSGMRIRLPEVSATWLTKLPSPTDKEITVNSTVGFPTEGVISIINDVDQIQKTEDDQWIRNSSTGVTTVEWIKYNGKTSNTFLECERGYMGTFPSTHSGYVVGNINATNVVNLRDHCPQNPLKTMDKLCQRRINRPYVSSSFPLFGYTGSIEDMTRSLIFDGTSFKLYPSNPYLPQMRKALGAVDIVETTTVTTTTAGGWQYVRECNTHYHDNDEVYHYAYHSHYCSYRRKYVPGTTTIVTIPGNGGPGIYSYGIWREKWSYNSQNVLALEYAFLQSEDYDYASIGRLTGLEAYSFVSTAQQAGSILSSTYADINWPENGIPVFNGRMDLSVGFAEWTYNNLPYGADYMSPESPRIVIYADGTVAGYLDRAADFSDVAQSVIAYSAKMIPGY
jgi:hypothetical protein